MAIGAVFGALNTMYSAVASRTREIATLRALGFGGGAVVVSLMLESLLLALVGGVIGGGLAYLAFNNFHTSTMNWQSFSQITFAFRVTPALLARGVVWAAVIGLIGGLFPAIGNYENFAFVNAFSRRRRHCMANASTDFQPSLRRNSAQAWAMFGALRMAETTQMRFVPAARTSSMFPRWMPPMANQGMFTFADAQRTYSSVTGFAPGLVPVANTGPMAM
jgi:hypothetical protein